MDELANLLDPQEILAAGRLARRKEDLAKGLYPHRAFWEPKDVDPTPHHTPRVEVPLRKRIIPNSVIERMIPNGPTDWRARSRQGLPFRGEDEQPKLPLHKSAKLSNKPATLKIDNPDSPVFSGVDKTF